MTAGVTARQRHRLERRRALAGLGVAVGLLALAFVLFARESWWQAALGVLFPRETRVLFERSTLLELALEHLTITGVSLGVIVAIALPAGIWLTRPAGQAFLPLASNVLTVGQTFPPVAVLALALPFFGFGLRPAVIALVAYGILPLTRSVITGLQGVPADLLDAADGLGMHPRTRLWRVELPLALPVIVAGLRISVVYTIGTATVAPIIGAGGLGVPIIAGLSVSNLALVLQGAVPVALLALLADFAVGRLGLVAGAGRGQRG